MHGWWSCQLSHHCMPQRRTAGPDGRSYHEPNLERPKVLKYWPAFHCPLFSLVSWVAMKNRARCEVDVEGMSVLLVKHQAQRTRNGGYLSTKHLCFGYLIFDLCQLDLCRLCHKSANSHLEISWAQGSGSRVWPSGRQQNIYIKAIQQTASAKHGKALRTWRNNVKHSKDNNTNRLTGA